MKAEENIPEMIQGMSGKLPFRVPDKYFDEFPSRIQKRVAETQMKPVFRFYESVRPRLAIAAMIIGLLAVGYVTFRTAFQNQDIRMLTEDEAAAAIEYFGYEFNDEMLLAAIIESDIDLDVYAAADTETEEIIEYLSTEEIDFEQLLNDY
jgi:hypothetical protein